jgi:hypothetical protein
MANYALTTVNMSGNLDDNYEVTVIDCANGNVTITLPSIVADGDTYVLVRQDSGVNSNLCTIAADGTDTVTGVPSVTLVLDQCIRVVSYTTNTNWLIISDHIF